MTMALGGHIRSRTGLFCLRSNVFTGFYHIIMYLLGRIFVGGASRDHGYVYYVEVHQNPFPICLYNAPLPLNSGRVFARH